MTLSRLRADFVLLIIAAYMLFDMGFSLVRLPPSGTFGVPMGEIIVLLFAACFPFEMNRTPAFAKAAPILPLMAWWLVGFTSVLQGFIEHGIWALRDGTHIIDTLFLWVGFVLACRADFLDRFAKWLPAVLIVGVIYNLGYPFRETLSNFSPSIYAPAGYTSPILFLYQGSALVLITAAVSILVRSDKFLGVPSIIVAGAIFAFSIVMFQQRSNYLQIIAVVMFLFLFRRRVTYQIFAGLGIGIAAFSLLMLSGIEITGRLGEKFTLDFFANHFMAIWGATGEGASEAVEGAAGGVSQRLVWWTKLFNQVTSDPLSLLFGLGHGIPLTDFRGLNGAIVREPHNSIISVFSRMGVVGLTAFLVMHFYLLRAWLLTYRWMIRNGETGWANNLLVIMVSFISAWIYSLGEDSFEKPFVAIPYYFFWGVILRLYYLTVYAELRRQPQVHRVSLQRTNRAKPPVPA